MIHDLHTLHRGLKWYHKYVFIPALVRPMTRPRLLITERRWVNPSSSLEPVTCGQRSVSCDGEKTDWVWFVWLWLNTPSNTGSCSGYFVVSISWFCRLRPIDFLPFSLSLSSHLVSKVRYEVRRQVCRVIDPGQTGVMEREEDLQRSECDVIQHPTDCLSDVRRKWGKVSDPCMV